MIRRAASLLLVLATVTSLSACARRADVSGWLREAEAAHADADERLAQKDVAGAREALRSAAQAPVPEGARAADARVVRQDLYYRWAMLEADQGAPEEAVRVATEGLALGRGNDAFTANLEIVRGRAQESLGHAADASRDYHDALLVTEVLLDESLGTPERKP
ncbi:MAG TPA: hypothetical protein VHE30_15180 [Polyangiaceae bacterium]|nr:hypothetical protein [Polyangiaceae bacterium]